MNKTEISHRFVRETAPLVALCHSAFGNKEAMIRDLSELKAAVDSLSVELAAKIAALQPASEPAAVAPGVGKR